MMGENYTGDPALGRACHNKRKRFDLAFEAAGLKATRRDFLSRPGRGWASAARPSSSPSKP